MALITDPDLIQREYEQIESGFARISDLQAIPVLENGEKLVAIDPRSGIISGYKGHVDMAGILDGVIYLREGAYERLLAAHSDLKGMDGDLTFDVRYGYRTDEIQNHYFFNVALPQIRAFAAGRNLELSEAELRDRAHWYAAFPEVAGHPTGGAIDLTLRNKRLGENLDMGVPVFGESATDKMIYFASPEISEQAATNRRMLRTAMEGAKFHGFAGEFWHHSYGDREWAFHQGEKSAIYAPIPLDRAASMIKRAA